MRLVVEHGCPSHFECGGTMWMPYVSYQWVMTEVGLQWEKSKQWKYAEIRRSFHDGDSASMSVLFLLILLLT